MIINYSVGLVSNVTLDEKGLPTGATKTVTTFSDHETLEDAKCWFMDLVLSSPDNMAVVTKLQPTISGVLHSVSVKGRSASYIVTLQKIG